MDATNGTRNSANLDFNLKFLPEFPMKSCTKMPPFIPKNKISSLEALKERLPNSILLAIDLKGGHAEEKIHELGLAILVVEGDTPTFHSGLQQFYAINQIRSETIEVQKRVTTWTAKDGTTYEAEAEAFRYGRTTCVSSNHEISLKVEEILEQYSRDRKEIILLAYDTSTEMKWIAQNHPSLVAFMSSWLDIQEFASQRCQHPNQVSLYYDAMHIMPIYGSYAGGLAGHTHAANDCVRSLAILTLLLTTTTIFNYPKLAASRPGRGSGVPAFNRIPESKSRYPRATLVVKGDCSLLPLRYSKPGTLVHYFRDYELKTVASRINKWPDGVRTWWFAFHTPEALGKFKKDVDGMVLDGVKLCIAKERDTAPPPPSVKPLGQYENLGPKTNQKD